ncbi:MAG TPA: M23 family metallopeptidase [Candidatus Faecivivens stercoripullorum]|uniref:M23 family metallopeptidase n=1 Tax=Candidatus Faecivivens stercoripullorum TaxID=2840805 RepID=A0A9D1H5P2_9FIRM|nr:M23 family metallopeptidase [Candidatus Faecivivens stercoripullorum]
MKHPNNNQNMKQGAQSSASAQKESNSMRGYNYDSNTSPNAQNMRSTSPNMPLESDNAAVDLSTDPLEGLDSQNDTGSCTGAEFGGYSRYSNGYTGHPEEVYAQNTLHPSATTSHSAGKKEKGGKTGLFLAIAVSAVALGAVSLLATGELPTSDGSDGTSSSITAQMPEESEEQDTQVDAEQEDIPKTENFVLDYQASSETTAQEETVELPSETTDESQTAESEVTDETQTASVEEEQPEDAAQTGTSSVSTPSTPESFVAPLASMTVTQPFSCGELVKSKTLGEWRTHDGLDLAAAEGEAVLSIADGLVEAVEKNARWGNTVTVNYGDYTAYYYGLGDAIAVQVGESVTAGQKLGEAGNSSLVESEEVPHIHLGIQKEGSWVDPALLLGLDAGEAETQPAESSSED